jgi:uncharacterized membrane protein YjfL (UPF0719 family)
MIDAFIDTLEFFPRGLVYVGLGIVVLLLAKLAQDIVTPYRIGEQLSRKDNVALGLSIAGYYFGVIAAFLGALYQPLTVVRDTEWYKQFDGDFGLEVLEVFLYSLAGIVVLNVARLLVDRLVLYNFNTEKEIIEEQNVGTGAVEFGVYVAVGLVIAASTAGAGESGTGAAGVSVVQSALRSLAFLGMGMVVLVLYTLFYQFTTSYDIHAEIEQKNTAVGVALGANLIAVGVVIFKAVFGEFVGWTESLAAFLTFAVIGFALLYVVRRLIDLVLFPRVKVADELAVDRNLGVAFIVGGVVISAALILFFAI